MNRLHLRFVFLLILSIFILAACGQGATEQEQEPAGTEEVTGNENATENAEEQPKQEDETETETETQVEKSMTEEAEQEQTIELFFSDDQVMDMYRVERTISSTEDQLLQKVLELWIQGPTEDGLISLVPETTEVQSVEIIDEIAHVSFSDDILEAQVGSGPEGMLLQQIALAMAQFGYTETQLLINGEVKDQFFGHIDTSQPIVASTDEFETR